MATIPLPGMIWRTLATSRAAHAALGRVEAGHCSRRDERDAARVALGRAQPGARIAGLEAQLAASDSAHAPMARSTHA